MFDFGEKTGTNYYACHSFNQKYLDGERTRPKLNGGRELFNVLIIILVMGTLAFVVVSTSPNTLPYLEQNISLEFNAETVNGMITDRYESTYRTSGRNARTVTVYHIGYQYRVGDQTYQQEETYEGSDPVGFGGIESDVTVRYSPENPAVASILPRGYWIGTLAIPGLFAGFALVIILSTLYGVWRKFQLATNGEVLNGTIKDADLRWVRRGKSGRTMQLKVAYSFVNPQGITVEGTRRIDRGDLRGKHPPMQGTPIKVVYMNDKWHMPV